MERFERYDGTAVWLDPLDVKYVREERVVSEKGTFDLVNIAELVMQDERAFRVADQDRTVGERIHRAQVAARVAMAQPHMQYERKREGEGVAG